MKVTAERSGPDLDGIVEVVFGGAEIIGCYTEPNDPESGVPGNYKVTLRLPDAVASEMWGHLGPILKQEIAEADPS